MTQSHSRFSYLEIEIGTLTALFLGIKAKKSNLLQIAL